MLLMLMLESPLDLAEYAPHLLLLLPLRLPLSLLLPRVLELCP